MSRVRAALDRLDAPTTPEGLRRLPAVAVLRQVWARHFVRAFGLRRSRYRGLAKRRIPG